MPSDSASLRECMAAGQLPFASRTAASRASWYAQHCRCLRAVLAQQQKVTDKVLRGSPGNKAEERRTGPWLLVGHELVDGVNVLTHGTTTNRTRLGERSEGQCASREVVHESSRCRDARLGLRRRAQRQQSSFALLRSGDNLLSGGPWLLLCSKTLDVCTGLPHVVTWRATEWCRRERRRRKTSRLQG